MCSVGCVSFVIDLCSIDFINSIDFFSFGSTELKLKPRLVCTWKPPPLSIL